MHQRRIIGVLGGMGPEATRDLFSKIIAATPATRDQEHLRIIIDNNPQVPDRTAHIVGNGPDPVPVMLDSAQVLARAGAQFIIIPCVSAHFFLDRLQAGSPLPILSVFRAVAQAALRQPGVTNLGLLATRGTVQGGAFARELARHGLNTLAPDEEHQELVMQAIYDIKADPTGQRRQACLDKLLAAADWLAGQGAQGLIAGCTEIPLVLRQEHLALPLFDPLDILAHAAVEHALH